MGKNELRRSVDGNLSSVLEKNGLDNNKVVTSEGAHLENVGNSVFPIHLLLHDSILVHAYCGKDVQHALVHRL